MKYDIYIQSDLTAIVTVSCEELVRWAECGSDASFVSDPPMLKMQAVGRYYAM